ncbi:MAG: hypothetical protein ACREQL_09130 [Candidatus Binatia bacterium]
MFLVLAAAALAFVSATHALGAPVTPNEARAIAKESYIYAFAMLESYNTMYKQLADPKATAVARIYGPSEAAMKGAWNLPPLTPVPPAK